MQSQQLDPQTLEKAAGMLKALAHPVRISIIGCLKDGSKRTVTEIHTKLGIEQSTASHHLVILNSGTGKYITLTDGVSNDSNPCWTPKPVPLNFIDKTSKY